MASTGIAPNYTAKSTYNRRRISRYTTACAAIALLSLGRVCLSHGASRPLPLPPPPSPIRILSGVATVTMPLPMPPPVVAPPMTLLAGPYLPMVKRSASKHVVPARLIAAVVYVETRAQKGIRVSSAGAIGPMQLMPKTAWHVLRINPWKPAQNIDGGTRYLRRLILRFGSVRTALIAYNEGPTLVDRGTILPAARQYATTVMRLADLPRLAPAQIGAPLDDVMLAAAGLTPHAIG